MHSHLMGAGERGNCASCQHYSRPVSTGSMRCRREGRWVTVKPGLFSKAGLMELIGIYG